MATITVTTQQSTVSANDYLSIFLTPSEALTGLVLSDVRLSGDLGVVPDEYSRLATHGIGYWFYARIPSTLGESGGSIRLQIYRSAVNPYLDSDLDVTIRWNSAGTIEILDTADVVYPELSISLNLDYVAIGDRVIATFRFTEVGTQTIREFTAADVSVTEGITKGTLVEVSNTEYTMEVTAPATGSGQGVISVAENRVYPSNTAASATFTYVDSISVDLSLSAASVEHGGVIAAQFDFDHDVPNFEGSLVAVSNSDATVGNATALDDDNRRWVVPVTAPQSGEGELEISLPEDAIGFSQAAVRAPVQFSDSIPLTIGSFADPLNPYIRDDFQVAIPITGNNVRFVDVTGLLRPFYPDWDPTTGTLYIRGRPTSFYEDLAFKITARDDNTTVEASGTITVIDRMPVIRPPSEIQLAKGHKNSIFIPVDNFPKEGSVKGSWLNLDHQVREDGILIVGDVPADAVFLNANVGTFLVEASNTGGSAPSASVPWKIVSATAPQWKTVKPYPSSGVPHGTHLERYLVFPAGVAINFNLNQFVTGVPVPTLTVDNLGIDGLELSELGYLIGTVTRNVVRDVLFKAENNEGVVYLWIRLYFYTDYPTPTYIGPSTISQQEVEWPYVIGGGRNLVFTSSSRLLTHELFNVPGIQTKNVLFRQASFYELLGLDSSLLYDISDPHTSLENQYHGVNNPSGKMIHFSREEYLANRFVLAGNAITDAHLTALRGHTHRVQIRMTNLLGSAVTPEFNIRIP